MRSGAVPDVVVVSSATVVDVVSAATLVVVDSALVSEAESVVDVVGVSDTSAGSVSAGMVDVVI